MDAHGDTAIRQVHDNQVLEERQVESDSSHFSSPMTSPVLGSTFRPLQEPTLGVYFEPADGEKNDVLAALRVTRKINRQALEAVQRVQPQTKQCLDFASLLQAQDKEMRQWILKGCQIDPTRTVAIRQLSLFARLARYVRHLRDVEMDLPSPPISTSRVGLMLRRLSSSASSGSSNSQRDKVDPRLIMAAERVSASFAPLKASIEDFMKAQTQKTALYTNFEKIRHDLNIVHPLCLPDTRVSLRNSIKIWAASSSEVPLVLVLLGEKGAGKSTTASMACCELGNIDMLHSAHFLNANSGPLAKRSAAPPARPRSKSLGGSLSPLSHSPFRSRGQTVPNHGKSLVTDIIKRINTPDAHGHVIVIDNADSLIHGEGLRLLEVVTTANSPDSRLRLLITCTTMPNWLRSSSGSVKVETLGLGDSGDAENKADIATYVSSRMCFSLSAADQQRLVDATDGNFAKAVRLCDLVEEGGSPERVLDTVLYQEMISKHGDNVSGHLRVVL